jgi:tetratricopeptide (TPR) repeat protein
MFNVAISFLKRYALLLALVGLVIPQGAWAVGTSQDWFDRWWGSDTSATVVETPQYNDRIAYNRPTKRFSQSYREAILMDVADKRREKDYTNALTELNVSLKQDPSFVMAYVQRGNIYGDMEKREQAIAEFTTAINMQPNLAVAYYNRARQYYFQGNFPQAERDYQRCIDLNPQNSNAFSNLATTQVHLRKYPEAVQNFTNALNVQGHGAVTIENKAMNHNNRGLAKEKMRDYRGALEDFKIAMETDPKVAAFPLNRGRMLATLGRSAEASRFARQAKETCTSGIQNCKSREIEKATRLMNSLPLPR